MEDVSRADLATIAKFQAPDGRLLVAFDDDYPGSEIPDEYKRHWISMERPLA